MKRALTIGLVLGLVLATGAAADVKTGKATGSKSPTFDLDAMGQIVITIMWTKKTADLDAGVFCPDDMGLPTLIAVGVSESDRVERIELGLVDAAGCFLGVAAFKGSSKFTASVFSSDGLGFARAPARVVDEELPTPERLAAIERLRELKRRSLGR